MTTFRHNLVKGYFCSILISNVILVFLSFVICLLFLLLYNDQNSFLSLFSMENTILCLVKVSVTKGEGFKDFKKIFPARFIRICIEWSRFKNLFKALHRRGLHFGIRIFIFDQYRYRKEFYESLLVQILIGLYLLCFVILL